MMEKLHSKRFIAGMMLIMTAVILLLCMFLTRYEMRISRIDISGIPVLTEDDGILVHFDDAYYQLNTREGEKLLIRGWAVVRGKETKPVTIHVLLRNRQTGECFRLPTEIKTRSDVTELLKEDYANYDSSGFVTSPVTGRFDFSHNEYDVLILYELSDGPYVMDVQQILTEKDGE